MGTQQFSICRHWILVLRSVGASQDLYWLTPKPTSFCRRSIHIREIIINYFLKRYFLPVFFVIVFLSLSIGDNLKTYLMHFILPGNMSFLKNIPHHFYYRQMNKFRCCSLFSIVTSLCPWCL